jgi:OOP family OmpA-OmpF porin
MKQLFLGAAALILSAAAGAETYIGAAIGPSNIEANCDLAGSCDKDDTGYKIYGGFVLPQSPLAGLALEVGYIDFGKANATYALGLADRSTEVSAVAFNAALRVKFTPAFHGVGRLGLGYVEGKDSGVNVLGVVNAGSESKSKLEPYFGLGLEYAINKQFKITGSADFTSYDTGNDTGSARLLSIGAQYSF